MRTTYKIIIACIITAIVSSFATMYIMNHQTYSESSEYQCKDNASPDINGCCPGEEYTNMGDQGFNCCPISGGDCFPPIEK